MKFEYNELITVMSDTEHEQEYKKTEYGTIFDCYTSNCGYENNYDWWDAFCIIDKLETRLPQSLDEIISFAEDVELARKIIKSRNANVIVCQCDCTMGSYPTFRFDHVPFEPLFSQIENYAHLSEVLDLFKQGKPIPEYHIVTSPQECSRSFHFFYIKNESAIPVCIGSDI